MKAPDIGLMLAYFILAFFTGWFSAIIVGVCP